MERDWETPPDWELPAPNLEGPAFRPRALGDTLDNADAAARDAPGPREVCEEFCPPPEEAGREIERLWEVLLALAAAAEAAGALPTLDEGLLEPLFDGLVADLEAELAIEVLDRAAEEDEEELDLALELPLLDGLVAERIPEDVLVLVAALRAAVCAEEGGAGIRLYL